MNLIHLNSLGWWLIIFLIFIGYFIFSFSRISNGTQIATIKIIGIILITVSSFLMGFFFGFLSTLALILILLIVVAPIVKLLIKKLEKKLYPERLKIRKEYAQKLNATAEEVDRVSHMNADKFWNEMRKKFKWLNNENNE